MLVKRKTGMPICITLLITDYQQEKTGNLIICEATDYITEEGINNRAEGHFCPFDIYSCQLPPQQLVQREVLAPYVQAKSIELLILAMHVYGYARCYNHESFISSRHRVAEMPSLEGVVLGWFRVCWSSDGESCSSLPGAHLLPAPSASPTTSS
jgi:hypothetical protein